MRMIQKYVFDYTHYKDYLKAALEARSREERGIRTRLAEAINCHTGYVSQVLNGNAHFSLEQSDLITRFLELNKDESAYLLLMVQFDRAGTKSLQDHFQNQMKEMVKKNLVLKNRLDFQKSLSREDQATFYSAWYYGAIHVLVTVPGVNTPKAISQYLNLPLNKVNEVLTFLQKVGLIVEKEGRLVIGPSHIHLEDDSPMISKHHSNWRMKAINAMDEVHVHDLHYSSVITCSEEDSVKIKSVLVKAIEEVRAIVRPSKEEGAFAYCLDFFGLNSKRD